MSERPAEATSKKRPRVWDAPEQARVAGGSGRKKKPPNHRVGGILAFTIFFLIFGFLWVFPTVSLFFLLDREPIQITVTDCYNGYGRGNTGGCDGTWTLADGTTGEGRFTESRQEYETGDVVDGVYIGNRAATGTLPWILDVAIVYPIAFLLTGGLAAKVVRDVRRQKRGEPLTREQPTRPPLVVRILGWSALVCAYAFFYGFPTASAVAMLTAEPVAITVSDCMRSSSLTARCHGEWTLADGTPGDGSIESWTKGLPDGAVIEGSAIGGRVVDFPATWLLDLVIFYPLAALLTYVHFRVVRKARRDRERANPLAEPGTISSCEAPAPE